MKFLLCNGQCAFCASWSTYHVARQREQILWLRPATNVDEQYRRGFVPGTAEAGMVVSVSKQRKGVFKGSARETAAISPYASRSPQSQNIARD